MADTQADNEPAARQRAGADKSQARSERDRRLAEALRANLRRRKTQAKAKAEIGSGAEAREQADEERGPGNGET